RVRRRDAAHLREDDPPPPARFRRRAHRAGPSCRSLGGVETPRARRGRGPPGRRVRRAAGADARREARQARGARRLRLVRCARAAREDRRGTARARRCDRVGRSGARRRRARRRAVRAREPRAPPRRRSGAVRARREPSFRDALSSRRGVRRAVGARVRGALAGRARGVLAGGEGGGGAGRVIQLRFIAPTLPWHRRRQNVSGLRRRWAMLRRWKTRGAVLGMLAAATASAHGRRGTVDYVYAKVVDVDPIVRRVTVTRPRHECWDEVVYTSERTRGVAGPAIAGGIIGGAIGRQFGGGSGRDALTIAGALAGTAIATEHAIRNQSGATRATTVTRCETVHAHHRERRIDGYRVTYQYRGRRHTIITPEPPGDRIRLLVSAIPVGY